MGSRLWKRSHKSKGIGRGGVKKSTCLRGHPFSGANLWTSPIGSARYSRQCRACNRMRHGTKQSRPGAPTRTHCKRGHNLSVTRLPSRGCFTCAKTRARIASFVSSSVIIGVDLDHLACQFDELGWDVRGMIARTQAKLETLKGNNEWQLAKLKLRAARALIGRKLNRLAVSPSQTLESKRAQTSPGCSRS